MKKAFFADCLVVLKKKEMKVKFTTSFNFFLSSVVLENAEHKNIYFDVYIRLAS